MKYIKYIPIVFVILLCYPLYITFLNPISPKSTINYDFDKNDKSISLQVDYSRPYKNGRLIFGTEEEGALVPYNNYWRTGANFCTDFYNSSEILFNGNKLDSGKYFLYTFPNENSWDIILNSDHGRLDARACACVCVCVRVCVCVCVGVCVCLKLFVVDADDRLVRFILFASTISSVSASCRCLIWP